MEWNGKTIGTVALGILCIVGGGAVSKYLSIESGTALIGFGGFILGMLRTPPAFSQPPVLKDDTGHK